MCAPVGNVARTRYTRASPEARGSTVPDGNSNGAGRQGVARVLRLWSAQRPSKCGRSQIKPPEGRSIIVRGEAHHPEEEFLRIEEGDRPSLATILGKGAPLDRKRGKHSVWRR